MTVHPGSRPAGDRAAGRLVTAERLGAWLLKCNADTSDLPARSAPGTRVDRWCVQPTYRIALMAAGQPVIFWVSGSRGPLPRGIWGVGYLTGPPVVGAVVAAPSRGRWSAPLDLTLLPAELRVRREELRRDARLDDLEVFRQPMAANPSFVTTEQLTVITEYVSWPLAR